MQITISPQAEEAMGTRTSQYRRCEVAIYKPDTYRY